VKVDVYLSEAEVERFHLQEVEVERCTDLKVLDVIVVLDNLNNPVSYRTL